MKKNFINHLQMVNESYWQHLKFANSIGWPMILAGIACIIHAFLPWLFSRVASNTINQLAQKLKKRPDSNLTAGTER